MTRFLASAATFAALALPAAAQEDSSGTITGLYNSDDAVWTIGSPEADDIPESGWRETEDGLEITLVGMPGPEAVGSGNPGLEHTLVVKFTLDGQPGELDATEPSVWMESGENGERMLAHPVNIDLSVTAAELSAGDLALAGDLIAKLTPGGLENLTIESEDAVLIDGNFQATLSRLGEAAGSSEGDGT
jgi:hypothetical protein